LLEADLAAVGAGLADEAGRAGVERAAVLVLLHDGHADAGEAAVVGVLAAQPGAAAGREAIRARLAELHERGAAMRAQVVVRVAEAAVGLAVLGHRAVSARRRLAEEHGAA